MASEYFPGIRKGYTELKMSGKSYGSGIFIRYVNEKPAKAPRKPSVNAGYLITREEYKNDSRGSTGSQLYLTLHVDEQSDDHFELTVTEAEVDSSIRVNPTRYYQTLGEFAPVWDAFVKHGDTESFAVSQLMVQGNDWSTRFTGLRCKTVRHELHHMYDNIRSCQNLLDNFMDEIRKVQRVRNASPSAKINKVMEALFRRSGFPSYDCTSAAHKKVALDDVYFMLAWYQENVLGTLPDDPKLMRVSLEATEDRNLHKQMERLSERYPWT